MFGFTFKHAVDTYYEDRREAERVMRLSRSDSLQPIQDNQELDLEDEEAS